VVIKARSGFVPAVRPAKSGVFRGGKAIVEASELAEASAALTSPGRPGTNAIGNRSAVDGSAVETNWARTPGLLQSLLAAGKGTAGTNRAMEGS
jgi:hypothetical protein